MCSRLEQVVCSGVVVRDRDRTLDGLLRLRATTELHHSNRLLRLCPRRLDVDGTRYTTYYTDD